MVVFVMVGMVMAVVVRYRMIHRLCGSDRRKHHRGEKGKRDKLEHGFHNKAFEC
jgi:hypothetical protein